MLIDVDGGVAVNDGNAPNECVRSVLMSFYSAGQEEKFFESGIHLYCICSMFIG